MKMLFIREELSMCYNQYEKESQNRHLYRSGISKWICKQHKTGFATKGAGRKINKILDRIHLSLRHLQPGAVKCLPKSQENTLFSTEYELFPHSKLFWFSTIALGAVVSKFDRLKSHLESELKSRSPPSGPELVWCPRKCTVTSTLGDSDADILRSWLPHTPCPAPERASVGGDAKGALCTVGDHVSWFGHYGGSSKKFFKTTI